MYVTRATTVCTYLSHTLVCAHVHRNGLPDSLNLFFCFSSLHLFSRFSLACARDLPSCAACAVLPLYDLTKTSAPPRDVSSSVFLTAQGFSSFPFAYLVVTFNGSARRDASHGIRAVETHETSTCWSVIKGNDSKRTRGNVG